MNPVALCYLAAVELAPLIRSREVSPVEVVEAHLARIDALSPRLNAYITVLHDAAMATAKQAEKEIREGRYLGPLHGIPFALKDLFYTAGVPTTRGYRLFANHVPSYDATAVARLKQAGAILLGKLNHHHTYGEPGQAPDYGYPRNPWDIQRIAGVSSGGSAAASAGGLATITLGTDTGGSIRQPASFCGIVGLKPTYGLVSRHGVAPLTGWSMDHVGPMTRLVEDCALVLQAIAGHDPQDRTSARVRVPNYAGALGGGVAGVRVGVVQEDFEADVEPQVAQAVQEAVSVLQKMGASIVPLSFPMFKYTGPIFMAALLCEAASYYREILQRSAPEVHPPVRLRLEAGLFVSATDYLRACRGRALLCRESLRLFQEVDVVAGPVVPFPAPRLGETFARLGASAAEVTPRLAVHSRLYNLNGFPAISLPCGFSREGLPIGLHLAARPFDEATLLRTAYSYQQATNFHRRTPPL